jgi:hypothetical protein
MAKKANKIKIKSPKKLLILEIESKISDTLKDFPKRSKGKRYQSKIKKASRILVKTLAIKQVKVVPKKRSKKTSKSVTESKAEVIS